MLVSGSVDSALGMCEFFTELCAPAVSARHSGSLRSSFGSTNVGIAIARRALLRSASPFPRNYTRLQVGCLRRGLRAGRYAPHAKHPTDLDFNKLSTTKIDPTCDPNGKCKSPRGARYQVNIRFWNLGRVSSDFRISEHVQKLSTLPKLMNKTRTTRNRYVRTSRVRTGRSVRGMRLPPANSSAAAIFFGRLEDALVKGLE